MSAPKSRNIKSHPRLHFLEWNPTGERSVVLVHGISANAWWWEWVAREFPERYRLLALDLRGHGDSEWIKPPAYQPHDYASDLARFIREAIPDEKPIVVGHSMGGLATLAFASRYPEHARGAVAIDVAVNSTRGRDRYLRRLKALPTVVYPDLETAQARFRLMPEQGGIPQERLHEIARRSLAKTEAGGYTLKFDRESFFGGDGMAVMETIREISIPMLLMRAELSRIMSEEASKAASESNSKTQLVVIPGAHHHVLLEKPREVAQALLAFIEGLDR